MTTEAHDPPDEVPLFVDMDGVLVRTDVTVEALFGLIRLRPGRIAQVFQWLRVGRAHLKRQVARHTEVDIAALPYDRAVIELLQAERARGRKVVLATAADLGIARAVADHLGLFDGVLGSDGTHDLSGAGKLRAIQAFTGGGPFDYAGNHVEDLAVFAEARRAWVVNPEPALRHAAARRLPDAVVVDGGLQTVGAYLAALGPRRWAIDLLVLLPALADPAAWPLHVWGRLALALVAFACCHSAMGIFGAMLHLTARRAHPDAARDAIAMGRVSPDRLAQAIPALTLAGLAMGLVVGWPTLLLLVAFSALLVVAVLAKRRAVRVLAVAATLGVRLLAGVSLVA